MLLGFIVLIATTGISVDLMNLERDRANLQSTLDRAVLAAADLDQTLPPVEVVNAYLEKSGLADKLTAPPTVVERHGTRIVSAQAETVIDTHFMRFSGIDTLTAKAASTAEESLGSVEISLVLDMSGSMSRASATPGVSKIAALKTAAKDFVTNMLSKTSGKTISISIIPYATQVNAGAYILDRFTNVSSEHAFSHCVNFTPNQFNSAALDPDTILERTAHFDIVAESESPNLRPVCATRAGSEITPMTDNITVLHNQIEALTPDGDTSIDVGMKWGAAMLDPALRPVTAGLVTDDIVPGRFNDRPLLYTDNVLKVIVIMTDGENTEQQKLRSDLRSGDSDVWYNPDYVHTNGVRGEYSVLRSESPPQFYWSRQRVTRNYPYGAGADEAGESNRLTYPELYNRVSVYWNAVNNYPWQPEWWQTWYIDAHTFVNSTNKNTHTNPNSG